MPDVSDDGFLGGRLSILQPRHGYRAGIDPVCLAAAVPAKPGDSVLELGTGVGTAILCVAARVSGLDLTGLELQPDYAELACKNAERNGIELRVIEGDLRQMPASLKARQFDHVIMNPPYFQSAQRSPAKDSGRETALATGGSVGDWVEAGLRRISPKGQLTMIQAAERLPDVLAALNGAAGTISVWPLAPRQGRSASRVIVGARRGKHGFLLHPPTILHAKPGHDGDAPDYTAATQRVLRDGKAWPWIPN